MKATGFPGCKCVSSSLHTRWIRPDFWGGWSWETAEAAAQKSVELHGAARTKVQDLTFITDAYFSGLRWGSVYAPVTTWMHPWRLVLPS